ncbi:MAG: primosomal protein N', partial [Cytophagaceae bacterium]
MENKDNTLFLAFESEEVTFFADLILPIPVPKLFTYRVPRGMTEIIKIGARVIVPFGKRNGRVLTAIVAKLHNTPPTGYQARYINEILDDYPLTTSYQLELFRWIAEYYMCCIGEVMNVALPSGLKISSQSKVQWSGMCS